MNRLVAIRPTRMSGAVVRELGVSASMAWLAAVQHALKRGKIDLDPARPLDLPRRRILLDGAVQH
jgi:hypothetical protein